MASFGQLVQMDTSEHFWLPLLSKETCMIALEDNHSRDLLDAELAERDTTWNNMLLIRRVIEEYGLFSTLYTDNDSMFKLIFMQERLCPVLTKVRNLKIANKIIRDWQGWYNKRIYSMTGQRPIDRHEPSAFKPLPSNINLDDVFCFKYQRTVKSDNTFSFSNKTYQISHFTNRISYAKAEIELDVLPGRCIRVFYKDRFVQQFSFKSSI